MGFFYKLALVCASGFMACLTCVSGAALADSGISAPCSKPGMRGCTNAVQGTAPFYPEMESKLRQRLQTIGDALYTTSQAGNATTCNLGDGIFNASTPETSQIHSIPVNPPADTSCGQPYQLRVHVPTLLGCVSGPAAVTIDSSGKNGTLENGYFHGGMIQALDCYYYQVVAEIETNGSLTLKDVGGQPSACTQLAQQVKSLQTDYGSQAAAVVTGLQNVFGGEKNLPDIWNCQKSWDTSALGTDPGELRQSAQNLCSARPAIEAAFLQLASCEIASRAQSAFQNRIFGTDPNTQQSYVTEDVAQVAGSVGSACSQYCQSKLGASMCNVPSDSAISACVQSCYEGKEGSGGMPAAIKKKILELWPTKPSSGNACQASHHGNRPAPFLPLLIGALGLPASSRKRLRGLGLLFCGYLALAASGCGCNNNQTTCNVEQMPTECSACKFDSFDVGSTLQGGAAAAQSASSSLETASDLVGGDHTQAKSTPGQMFAQNGQSAAATAGLSNAPARSGAGGAGLEGASPGGSQSGGSAGGGSSGLMAGWPGMDDARTDPSGVTASPRPTDATADSAGGGLYAAAVGGDEGGAGRYGRHPAGMSVDAPANADSAFGDTGGNPMGTADPADYFTRIGLADSIFVIVHKRYTQQAMGWAQVDLAPRKR